MAEDPSALPNGETYTDSQIPLDEAVPDNGRNLVLFAETVNERIEDMYQKAIDRRNYDRRGVSNGELDKELVNLLAREVPEAIEELGERIEHARNVENIIHGDDSGNLDYVDSSIEGEFLENYREAEGLYREVFENLGRQIDGRNLAEYLDDRYRIDFPDCIGEVPDPRANNR